MNIERFYLDCLAHASYLVHDAGEAAVIDPQRDVDLYLDFAREHNLTLRWIIETHLHADFVSGHLELARRTGATIAAAANSGATYPHRALHDGDTIAVGHASLKVLTTPGHTEESICLVALEDDAPKAVFTGDTLFIGDVGRPDLSPTRSPEELAGLLYDSLHTRLLTLPEDTIVYPAHGAGSLCGRSMSADASSTIARERRTNYALQPMSRHAFVHLLTGDMPPRPAYFQDEVQRNRSGATPLDDLSPVPSLSPAQLLAAHAAGAIVLDTRPWNQFAAAHIPGSLNIALRGQFASWAARILGLGNSVALVAENEAALQESRMRLARVGIEDVRGALAGGILAWIDQGLPTQSIENLSAAELTSWLAGASHTLVDVRDPAETHHGAIPGATFIPLPDLQARVNKLDPARPVAVHCRGGYRSAIAASLLQSAGFTGVFNLTGGYDAWALTEAAHAVV